MSGGSFNYLYCKDGAELFNYVSDIEDIEAALIKLNYIDVAKDTRRLIEYLKTALVRIDVLNEQLKPIFRAVEYYYSSDIGKESVHKAIEKYRDGKPEEA